MKLKHSIIALLTLGLLVAVLYHLKKRTEINEEKTEKEKLVFGIDKSDLSSFVVKNDKGEFAFKKMVRVEPRPSSKSDDNEKLWYLTEPVTALADQSFVEGIVSSMADLSSERTIKAKKEDLSQYGLSDPSFSIRAQWGKPSREESLVAHFGQKNPGGASQYVRLGNKEEVMLAGVSLDYLKDKELKDFRKKEIFDFKKDQVEEITALYPADKQEFVIKKEGQDFQIIKPLKAKAEKPEIDKFLNDIRNLRAADFPSENYTDDPQRWGFTKPYADIKLKFSDKSETSVDLGKETSDKKNLYLKTSNGDNVLEVGKNAKTDLTLKLKYIVDRKVNKWKAEDVREMFLSKGKRNYRITRYTDYWFLKTYDDMADTNKTHDILSRLANLRAKEFVSKKVPKTLNLLKHPTFSASVIDSGNQFGGLLAIDKIKGTNEAFVWSGPGSFLMKMDSAPLDKILDDLENIRSKKFYFVNKDEVNVVRYARENGLITLSRKKSKDGVEWIPETSKGMTFDSKKSGIEEGIDDLLSFLTDDSIQGYVDDYDAKKAPGQYGFVKPRATIAIGENKMNLINVFAGNKDASGKYAFMRKEQLKPIYKVKAEDLDKALKIFEAKD